MNTRSSFASRVADRLNGQLAGTPVESRYQLAQPEPKMVFFAAAMRRSS